MENLNGTILKSEKIRRPHPTKTRFKFKKVMSILWPSIYGMDTIRNDGEDYSAYGLSISRLERGGYKVHRDRVHKLASDMITFTHEESGLYARDWGWMDDKEKLEFIHGIIVPCGKGGYRKGDVNVIFFRKPTCDIEIEKRIMWRDL